MNHLRSVSRALPRARLPLRPWGKRCGVTPVASGGGVRRFYRGPLGRDPFVQMEQFMRDMERKFKRDVEDTMGSLFRRFPGRELSGTGIVPRSAQSGFGEMDDLSTTEKYKLCFHFPSAKPEDVKVTLKDRTLKVSGEAVVETDNARSTHDMKMEFQVPDDVELDALESSLTQEGILTVEAPRNPAAGPEAPKAIPVNRE